MFNKTHHQLISEILSNFNSKFMKENQIFFAGGSAISMLLGEYRESIDIDFLSMTTNGYRAIRNEVTNKTLGKLISEDINFSKEIMSDRYGIRTVINYKNVNIRFEIVSEARIGAIKGSEIVLYNEDNSSFLFPILSKQDLLTQKILTIADRGLDKSYTGRDVFDSIVIGRELSEKEIQESIKKAFDVYGQNSIERSVKKSTESLFNNDEYFLKSMNAMSIEKQFYESIKKDKEIILSNMGLTFTEIKNLDENYFSPR